MLTASAWAWVCCLCCVLVDADGADINILPDPPSTLLTPGATALPLKLTTAQSTTCKWGLTDVPFGALPHTFAGAGSTSHSATLTGLSGTLALTAVHVRCAAYSEGLTLVYRSLPDTKATPFPRLGNLWGSGNFKGHPEGLAYAAKRASLWLGSDWTAEEIAELRKNNPGSIVLTSINACETNRQDLPDDYYLTNITRPAATKGRLQSWPGAWRLDLTNPAVQKMQAELMYGLVAYGGEEGHPVNRSGPAPLTYDGLFVDNVFMDDGAGANRQDIFHNSFIPADPATGKPIPDFNERWRSGMVAELQMFREMMPHALMDGHAMHLEDANISASFNAISIGFTTPEIIEGRTSFAQGFKQYQDWMTLPQREPHITMVESAVRFQIGYGYGFGHNLTVQISDDCENSNSVAGAPTPAIGDACANAAGAAPGFLSPETYLFARSEYQYMRFGLGFTLMNDGYYTHELGDSWHGMDWDYDELQFNLGLATSNASTVPDANPPPLLPSIPLRPSTWSLFVDQRTAPPGVAKLTQDATEKPMAHSPPSQRIEITKTAPNIDGIDLQQNALSFHTGGYQLSFWAKSSKNKTPVTLDTRKQSSPWTGFGLMKQVYLTTAWAQYNVTFTSPVNSTEARLSYYLGFVPSGTTVWISTATLAGTDVPPPVMRREFDCGVVILNGDTLPHTIAAGPGLKRLTGQQAPRHQYFVDDNSSAFKPSSSTAWVWGNFNSGYKGGGSEEVRPPDGFYHHWERGAHTAPAGSSATFDLQIPATGKYSLKMWWPAAVPARAGWATAMAVTVASGSMGATANISSSSRSSSTSTAVASMTVDLTKEGGDMWYTVAKSVQLAAGDSTLTISCPSSVSGGGAGGACVADAVLVESEARWNDGSAVVDNENNNGNESGSGGGGGVALQSMDAIVLARTNPPPHCGSSVV